MSIDELHVHSDGSLLDGEQQVKDIVAYAKKHNIAVTLTDHGNMVNTYKIYTECKEADVKCNIGCEFYFTPSFEQQGYTHLILIAKNNVGYQNLLKLQYYSYMEGFYYKPRIDLTHLTECSKGLICLSACIGGIIPKLYLAGDTVGAVSYINIFKKMFGDDFYLEIQPHAMDKQVKVNKWLVEMSRTFNVPLVVTSDAHYVSKDLRDVHDTVICMGYHQKKFDDTRRRYETTNAFNSEDEIVKEFIKQGMDANTIGMAMFNTRLISNKCNVSLECNEVFLPKMHEDDDKKLALMCSTKFAEKKARGLFKDVNLKDVIERIKYELKILKSKGFSGYFLIVEDMLTYCRTHDIPIGPGRGSVAGSEVAFLLDIHKLEPIKHGLIFERFLNTTRNGYPDIDSDVCYERRSEVIDYLSNKYGKDNIASVMALGHMTTSNVIRKVLTVYGYESTVINNISTKYIPRRLGITLKEAYTESSDLRDFLDKNDDIKRDCFALENNISHFGKHAAGLIICSDEVWKHVPVMRDEENKKIMKTQWDKKIVEKCGLIKFDILGLKMLTTYAKMIRHVKRLRGIKLNLDELYEMDLENKIIYDILNSGNLGAIFQFSEYAGKQTILNAEPQCFEDVMACESICRPGVKEDQLYINNKANGYELSGFDVLDEILAPTFGAIVYQEQTMMILHKIGGMTLGEADSMRKVKSLEPYREDFIRNALYVYKITVELAVNTFDRLDLAYSFNKSHAGVYGIHSCVNAYCKHTYFTEYMSAYMSMEMLKEDAKSNIVDLLMECKSNGITFIAPDINLATNEFIPLNDKEIMLPINFIKGLGEKTILEIVKHRPYTDIKYFLSKVTKRNVNKTSFQKLIKAGAFSFQNTNTQQLLQEYCGFKEMYWCDELKMHYERDTLGLTLGRHPLDNYINIKVSDFSNESQVSINALINSVVTKIDKNGNMMAFIKCENKVCAFECVIFSYLYPRLQLLLLPNAKVNILGKVDNGKILVKTMKFIQ